MPGPDCLLHRGLHWLLFLETHSQWEETEVGALEGMLTWTSPPGAREQPPRLGSLTLCCPHLLSKVLRWKSSSLVILAPSTFEDPQNNCQRAAPGPWDTGLYQENNCWFKKIERTFTLLCSTSISALHGHHPPVANLQLSVWKCNRGSPRRCKPYDMESEKHENRWGRSERSWELGGSWMSMIEIWCMNV